MHHPRTLCLEGRGERGVAFEAEAETKGNLSRGKLRYVRPGDRNAPMNRAPCYNDNDSNKDQGEIFPVDADDDAYDWDEAEDDGIAPRVVRDVKTPTAQEMEEHNCTHTSHRNHGVRRVWQGRSQTHPTSVRLRGSILCQR